MTKLFGSRKEQTKEQEKELPGEPVPPKFYIEYKLPLGLGLFAFGVLVYGLTQNSMVAGAFIILAMGILWGDKIVEGGKKK